MAQESRARRMEQIIHSYFEACNNGDAKAIAACFVPDAVHYFPDRARWVGANAIGIGIAKLMQDNGGYYTVDQVLTDIECNSAALEWSKIYRDPNRILRGLEFYVFDPAKVLIKEIRGYYATPPRPELARHELIEFDYAGRGYPTN
jgi:hypothetical protein